MRDSEYLIEEEIVDDGFQSNFYREWRIYIRNVMKLRYELFTMLNLNLMIYDIISYVIRIC